MSATMTSAERHLSQTAGGRVDLLAEDVAMLLRLIAAGARLEPHDRERVAEAVRRLNTILTEERHHDRAA